MFLSTGIRPYRVSAEELWRSIEIIRITERTVGDLVTVFVFPCNGNFLWFPITYAVIPIEIGTVVIEVLIVRHVIGHAVNNALRLCFPPYATCISRSRFCIYKVAGRTLIMISMVTIRIRFNCHEVRRVDILLRICTLDFREATDIFHA